jgi:hypothetical protein
MNQVRTEGSILCASDPSSTIIIPVTKKRGSIIFLEESKGRKESDRKERSKKRIEGRNYIKL